MLSHTLTRAEETGGDWKGRGEGECFQPPPGPEDGEDNLACRNGWNDCSGIRYLSFAQATRAGEV